MEEKKRMSKAVWVILMTLTLLLTSFSGLKILPQHQAYAVSAAEEKASADDAAAANDAKEEAKDEEETDEEPEKPKPQATVNYSTLYALFLMSDAKAKMPEEKKEPDTGMVYGPTDVARSFENTISGVIGNGGVVIDIPYNKMASMARETFEAEREKKDAVPAGGFLTTGGAGSGNDADGAEKEGKVLASLLATHHYYGYISTVSGNALAATISSGFILMARVIAGMFVLGALIWYTIINLLFTGIIDFLIAMNPYRMLGFTKGTEIMPDNAVSAAIFRFFDALGLNAELWTTIAELGFVLALFMLGVRLIMALAKFDIRGKDGVISLFKKFIVQIVIFFAFFPLMGLAASGIASSTKDLTTAAASDDAPPLKYLFNTRYWASVQNLTPSEAADEGAGKNHIDSKLAPTKQRDWISKTNQSTYKVMEGIDPDAENGGTIMAYSLLERWISNDTFNVNTYIADVRGEKTEDIVARENYANIYNGYLSDETDKKNIKIGEVSGKNLEYAMWSATQNADDKLRDPKHANFLPGSPVGVKLGESGENSFSTQSVVLLLQSSLDSASAKFYAYNIAPEGVQGALKNVSTVKTEWKQVVLPGEGFFGIIGSWMAMTADSLAYIFLSVAVLLALLTMNIVSAFTKFVQNVFVALIKGSPHAALATAFIFLAGIVSLLIAVNIPGVFLDAMSDLGAGISAVFDNALPITGLIDILRSIAVVLLAWYVSFGAKIRGTGLTPVRFLVTAPLEAAFNYSDKVKELDRSGASISESLKRAGHSAGDTVGETTSAMASHAGNSARAMSEGTKGAIEQGAKGTVTGAVKGGMKGAITGGVPGAVAGAATGAALGGALGAKNGAKQGAEDGFNDNVAKTKGERKSKSKQAHAKTKEQLGKTEKYYDKGIKEANHQDLKPDEKKNRLEKAVGDNTAMGAIIGSGANQHRKLSEHKKRDQQDKKWLDERKRDEKDEKQRRRDIKHGLTVDPTSISGKEATAQKGHIAAAAALAATAAMRQNGEKMFDSKDIQALHGANSEKDFTEKLADTEHGHEYALDTKPAKESLADSEFVDKDGNVDMDKVNDFREAFAEKSMDGSLTAEDIEKKKALDAAFLAGSNEIFNRENPDKEQSDDNSDDKPSIKNPEDAEPNGAKSAMVGAAAGAAAGIGAASMLGDDEREAEAEENQSSDQMNDNGVDMNEPSAKETSDNAVIDENGNTVVGTPDINEPSTEEDSNDYQTGNADAAFAGGTDINEPSAKETSDQFEEQDDSQGTTSENTASESTDPVIIEKDGNDPDDDNDPTDPFDGGPGGGGGAPVGYGNDMNQESAAETIRNEEQVSSNDNSSEVQPTSEPTIIETERPESNEVNADGVESTPSENTSSQSSGRSNDVGTTAFVAGMAGASAARMTKGTDVDTDGKIDRKKNQTIKPDADADGKDDRVERNEEIRKSNNNKTNEVQKSQTQSADNRSTKSTSQSAQPKAASTPKPEQPKGNGVTGGSAMDRTTAPKNSAKTAQDMFGIPVSNMKSQPKQSQPKKVESKKVESKKNQPKQTSNTNSSNNRSQSKTTTSKPTATNQQRRTIGSRMPWNRNKQTKTDVTTNVNNGNVKKEQPKNDNTPRVKRDDDSGRSSKDLS